jgi:hypothetical protein
MANDLTIIDDESTTLVEYPPLTQEEDTFALAMIEYSGNVVRAYKAAFGDDSRMPQARGIALMQLPQVALRIRDLNDAIKEASHISLGTHLMQLAAIRDEALNAQQFKVALHAERSRGEAMGYYMNSNGGGKHTPQVAIQVNFASPHDKAI